jgi:hypothetical protein
MLAALLAVLLSPVAQAEYRAFELVISNSLSGQERTVLSNLDPDQYRGYHPLNPGESISYRATWMCKGNTSDQAVCQKPEKPAQGPNLKSKNP